MSSTFFVPKYRSLAWAPVFSLCLLVIPAHAQGVYKKNMGKANASAEASGFSVLARGPYKTVVTVDDLRSELLHVAEETRQELITKPGALQQLANNLLVRRVLAREAEQEGLGKNPIVKSTVAIARDRVMSDARLLQLDMQNEPNEERLKERAQNIYDTNPARFDTPAQTRASHILLPNKGPDDRAKALEVLAQLRAGGVFEELAKAKSIDTGSAARGGDLGYFGPGKMVPVFEAAVNMLAKPGDISDPVPSQFGYHIIRLDERREAGRKIFEEVKEQLMAEARILLLNDSRVRKVQMINQQSKVNTSAIDALTKHADK